MAGQFGGNPHFRTSAVTVETSAISVVDADGSRLMLHLANESDTTVYIGGAGVTPDTGFPVLALTTKTISTRDAVYAASESGTATLKVLEEYS